VTHPFPLVLRGTGTFRPVSPVVYIRVADGAARCDDLQQRIRTGPLQRELDFPFHPHVTVAHHVDDPALDRALVTLQGFTADLVVDSFALYEHGLDGVWRHRRGFAFAATS
jgi:2'-5' RNA ligase